MELTETLYIAIITACSTLLAVLIGNWFNSKENQKRIDSENEEKDKQRVFELRKEIYLSTAEKIVEMSAYLPAIINNTELRGQIEIPNSFSININRLSIVSSAETSLKALEINKLIFSIYLQVMEKLSGIIEIESNEFALKSITQKNQLEIDRLILLIKSLLESSDIDDSKLKAINNSLEIHQNMQKKYWEELDEISNSLITERIQISKYVLERVQEINADITQFMVLIRKEIGMKDSPEEILRFFQQNSNELIQQGNSTLEKFK